VGVLEQPRRGRLLVAGLIVLGLAAGGFAAWFRATAARPAVPRPAERRIVPGEDGRVVVEVLNASGETGLARLATRRLRDAGLDVVYYGSDTADALDSTEVLLRRGDASAAERVRGALGTARAARPAPDPTRLVDVTVRVGRDFGALLRDP
jgi:hypothetical protein